MDIEFCVQNLEEVVAADTYGAKRVELCAALELGGLTPSYGMVDFCVEAAQKVEVHPILRPLPGGFVYDGNTIEVMRRDILSFASLGVKGVVFGVLDQNHNVALFKNKVLLDFAKSKGLEVTFHRAIDFTADYLKSLEDLVSLGFDRILTSGQSPTAFEGINRIKELALQASGRIQIMAGSGVNAQNAMFFTPDFLSALHFTISRKVKVSDVFNMGETYEIDTLKITEILKAVSKSA